MPDGTKVFNLSVTKQTDATQAFGFTCNHFIVKNKSIQVLQVQVKEASGSYGTTKLNIDPKSEKRFDIQTDEIKVFAGRVDAVVDILAVGADVAGGGAVGGGGSSGGEVTLPDSYMGISDAQRVAEEITQFDTQFNYNKGDLFWGETNNGGGSASHNANQSVVDLSVATANGDRITRQTHMHFRYQPGVPTVIEQSFIGQAHKAGVRFRLGAFFANDGLYLEQIENGGNQELAFVIRSSTTGSPAEAKRVIQSSWNLDTLDGNGGSGKTLDMTKCNLFLIEFKWLGAGPVRMGFEIDGQRIWAHRFNNQDIAVPYMATGNLPLAIELENTAAPASGSTVKQVCAVIRSQGGKPYKELPGLILAAGTQDEDKDIDDDDFKPVFSIRPKATFGGKTNYAHIITVALEAFGSSSDDIVWQLRYGGTLTGDSFVDVNATFSAVQCDKSATAISGGLVLSEFYGERKTVASSKLLSDESKASLTLKVDGSAPVLSLCAKNLSNGGAKAYAGMQWKELHS